MPNTKKRQRWVIAVETCGTWKKFHSASTAAKYIQLHDLVRLGLIALRLDREFYDANAHDERVFGLFMRHGTPMAWKDDSLKPIEPILPLPSRNVVQYMELCRELAPQKANYFR